MDRRHFLVKGTTVAAGLAASDTALAPLTKASDGGNNVKPIPRRKLGKTGEELSIVGFAGIVVMENSQSFANHIVAEAVDRGINYFDVAPTYGDAQARLGPALEPYRKNVFLACKEEAGISILDSRKSRRYTHPPDVSTPTSFSPCPPLPRGSEWGAPAASWQLERRKLWSEGDLWRHLPARRRGRRQRGGQ